MDVQTRIDEFNQISDALDYAHWLTYTEYGHDGKLILTATLYACGFEE